MQQSVNRSTAIHLLSYTLGTVTRCSHAKQKYIYRNSACFCPQFGSQAGRIA